MKLPLLWPRANQTVGAILTAGAQLGWRTCQPFGVAMRLIIEARLKVRQTGATAAESNDRGRGERQIAR